MSENIKNDLAEELSNESVKELANVLKKVNASSVELAGVEENTNSEMESSFKVCETNLPAKPSVWTKIKNALFYEIKVELTPHQQKVEDEINEFLHQEITWQSFKSFLFKEVPITFRGKRVF